MDQHRQLIETLYAELGHFKRVMMGARDQLMSDLQLSRNQVEVMMLLAHDKDQTVGDVASRLAVTHSASTQTIETLVKRGLVQRRPDDRDRRIVRVELSAAGNELTAKLRRSRLERLDRVMGDLTDDELRLMTDVVKKLAGQFDPANKKETPHAP